MAHKCSVLITKRKMMSGSERLQDQLELVVDARSWVPLLPASIGFRVYYPPLGSPLR